MPPSTTWSALTAPASSATTATSTGDPFVNDTFVDAANTALTSHTGEEGATWTEHTNYSLNGTSVLRITDQNRVHGDGGSNPNGAAIYYTSGVPDSADYQVSCIVHPKSMTTGNTLCDLGVFGRLSTSTEAGYLAYYNRTNAIPRWELYANRGSSTYVLLSTYTQTLDINTDYSLVLRMEGSALTVSIDGVARMSANTTAVTAAGRAGVRFYFASPTTYNTGLHMDNFRAETLSSVSTTVSPTPAWTASSRPSTTWASL